MCYIYDFLSLWKFQLAWLNRNSSFPSVMTATRASQAEIEEIKLRGNQIKEKAAVYSVHRQRLDGARTPAERQEAEHSMEQAQQQTKELASAWSSTELLQRFLAQVTTELRYRQDFYTGLVAMLAPAPAAAPPPAEEASASVSMEDDPAPVMTAHRGFTFCSAREVKDIPRLCLPIHLFFLDPNKLEQDDRIVVQLHWCDVLKGNINARLVDDSDGITKRASSFCQITKIPQHNVAMTMGNVSHVRCSRMFVTLADADRAIRKALMPESVFRLQGRAWYLPYRPPEPGAPVKFVPLITYVKEVGFEKNTYTLDQRNSFFINVAMLFTAGKSKKEQDNILRRSSTDGEDATPKKKKK